MSETCQRLNVRVGMTNLVTHLCYASHLGVPHLIGVQRETQFVVLNFPFLDCWNAFSECGPATHSIYVLGHRLQQAGTDFFHPVLNPGRPSPWDSWWCHNDGCSADMMVAEWIWGSLSGYDSHQVNVDWSQWIGEDCLCYLPASTTRCALTHAGRDDHSNTDFQCDANLHVNPVENAPQIKVRRVWRSKMLLSWDKSNR